MALRVWDVVHAAQRVERKARRRSRPSPSPAPASQALPGNACDVKPDGSHQPAAAIASEAPRRLSKPAARKGEKVKAMSPRIPKVVRHESPPIPDDGEHRDGLPKPPPRPPPCQAMTILEAYGTACRAGDRGAAFRRLEELRALAQRRGLRELGPGE